jgi:hypothetical protein
MLTEATRPKAEAVLKLVANALRARGHRVQRRPSQIGPSWRAAPIIVDDVGVRLSFKEEHWHSYRLAANGRSTSGRLIASIEGIWGNIDTKLFRSAKARTTTHGLNVQAMCDHIEKWIVVRAKLDEAEQRANTARTTAQAAKSRLEKDHPNATDVLRITDRGLLFKAVVSEETARDLLRVLAEHEPANGAQ